MTNAELSKRIEVAELNINESIKGIDNWGFAYGLQILKEVRKELESHESV